ncbi:hypothetical protein LNP18_06260 [Leuconostoc citreum]|uniref:hypothetical protein n=1 Tax=Leuconostoc citreum TaxID=33964 RepID=UPI00200B958E|nr:hypothetical protein [Leuconostoc citreum]MCK8605706.1 hypothetical protein [Leuconostoc citreum]
MTNKTRQRDQQLKQYLRQLHADDWHRPGDYKKGTPISTIKKTNDYYYAQLALVLLHNYHQPYRETASILNIPLEKVYRLSNAYTQDYSSIEAVHEAIKHG